MRSNVLTGGCLLLALTSCSKEPAAQYRLSNEQLAWQGYHADEVLRFGHGQDAKVRTYHVTSVRDYMQKGAAGTNLTPFPTKEAPEYQHVVVTVQRTDSIFQPQPVLDLEIYDDLPYSTGEFRAEASWEAFYGARLPLDAVNQSIPIDTLQYAATLLPSASLGLSTYPQVIRVDSRNTFALPAGARPTRRLYYARGKGVVAFEEDGTGLWYRLP